MAALTGNIVRIETSTGRHSAAPHPESFLGAPRVVILGLPNSGKSQLFNDLTGGYVLVANYPLTTVEPQRRTALVHGRRYVLEDTPGLYGLYGHSEEEISVREELFADPPDGLIVCTDVRRLKQSLLLIQDLAELDLPLLVALTGTEESRQRGLEVDPERLAEALGALVVEHRPLLAAGLEKVRAALERMQPAGLRLDHGAELERRLSLAVEAIPGRLAFRRARARLLLAGDPSVARSLEAGLSPEERTRLQGKTAEARRGYRGSLHRALNGRRAAAVEEMARRAARRVRGRPGRAAAAAARLCRHPVAGLPILAAVVALTYVAVVYLAGWLDRTLSVLLVDPALGVTARLVSNPFWKDFLMGDYGLLTLGLFNALVTVLPILSVFFLILGLLEDVGYLPNLTVLARRVLEKVGLSGRSVMSLILGFGCKTMATLTTRGITSRRERYIAIFLIAFAIPCSAQLGIDLSILGRVGLQAALIAFGTLAAVEIGAGLILNRIQPPEPRTDFIQELPPLRLPDPRASLRKTGYRLWWFLKEALPIFLVAAVAMFALHRLGVLGWLEAGLRPVVTGWLGLPERIVEVLILSMARHEAGAGLLLSMVGAGALSYGQVVVAVVLTTMFVPCFANIVAMCRQLGLARGLLTTLVINAGSFVLAGLLRWALVLAGVAG